MKNIIRENVEACPVCHEVPGMRLVNLEKGLGVMIVCKKIMFADHAGMGCVSDVSAENTAKKWNKMVEDFISKKKEK